MENDNYTTTLRSKLKDRTIGFVEIRCKDFQTFCRLVEAVSPILVEDEERNNGGDVE